MSSLSSRIRPSVRCSKPPIARSKVVLPQPDGPKRVKNSLLRIETDTFSRAVTAWSERGSKILDTPRNSTAMLLMPPRLEEIPDSPRRTPMCSVKLMVKIPYLFVLFANEDRKTTCFFSKRTTLWQVFLHNSDLWI